MVGIEEKKTFSSILLDEICRSMVEDDMNVKLEKNKEGEKDVMTLRKACSVEKWMEEKVRDKVAILEKRKPGQFIDDLHLRCTSSSSGSDDCSGGLPSCGDSNAMPFTCDLGKRPNPIRTSRSEETKKITSRQVLWEKPSSPAETVVKSKAKASTIYDHLKTVKQPASPGGKLRSLINSLYHATKQAAKSSRVRDDSVCSSAGSSLKPCIGNEANAKSKLREDMKRKVSILPRCGRPKERKNMCPREDAVKSGQNPGGRRGSVSARFGEEMIAKLSQTSKLVMPHARSNTQGGAVGGATAVDDEDFDALSCASSDLFEICHITYGARCR